VVRDIFFVEIVVKPARQKANTLNKVGVSRREGGGDFRPPTRIKSKIFKDLHLNTFYLL